MKAKLQGRILSVSNKDGDAEITFETKGKVEKGEGPVAPSAREVSMTGNLKLKAVIADAMKIGAVITVTISDEEADARLD